MKKLLLYFILVVLISFVSCDTFTHYTIRVSVDRNPTLIIENQTGYQVTVTAPVASRTINNGARTQFQPTETRGTINITYRIGQDQFTEQVTIDNTDVTVTLTRRPPTITVVNNTGYDAAVSAPFSLNMRNEARHDFMAPRLNQNIDITYRVGQMTFTEQVTIDNADVTVTLTRRPPTITLVNNVGATINTIFLRPSGSPDWVGGNIFTRDGILHLRSTAQTGDISGSIVNRDSRQIWMGTIALSGDRFDIRIDDVDRHTYVKSNVQITDDITLTFTAADRR